MKVLFLTLILCFSSSLFGQSFEYGYRDSEFKSLMSKGLFFLKTGDSLKDASYILALKDNWDISKVTVLDSISKDQNFSGKEIFLIEGSTQQGGDVLGLIPLSFLVRKSFSSKSLIGFMEFNGFDQNSESKFDYLDLTISGLNSIVKTIDTHHIGEKVKAVSMGLYKDIHKSILPKSKTLQTKTLLIIDDTDRYVSESALNKSGIKFEKISREEYVRRNAEGELNDYCLLYFAYNEFTEISIFDLETHDLIFSKHFVNAKRKFTNSDISEIKKQWK